MAKLLSVNVGLPRDIEWHGKTVRTAIWKEPVTGRRRVRRLNIDGDGQGDLARPRGRAPRRLRLPDRFVSLLGEGSSVASDFVYGQFGENFTVDGLSDEEVCIGDRYRIGSALFEVTQPRVTCYRVGIRMEEPRDAVPAGRARTDRASTCASSRKARSAPATRSCRWREGPERMTVAEANALLYLPGHPRRELERALRIPAFSHGWRTSFQALLDAQASGRPVSGNPALASAGPTAAPGFRTVRVARGHARERQRDLLRPGADGRSAASARAARAVRGAPHAADARGAAAAAELFAVRPAGAGAVPHQREARAARRGERLPARQGSRRRLARGERAARQLHARTRRAPRSSCSAPASG